LATNIKLTLARGSARTKVSKPAASSARFVLDRRWGIAQASIGSSTTSDLDRFASAAAMDMIQRPGSEVVDHAVEWCLRAEPNRPFFAWVHLYDAHTPYDAPEPFQSRFPRTKTAPTTPEIANDDAQVRRLLEALRAAGRLDETLVIVVADHGEMLGEHGELTHGFFIYEGATHIPLIVSGPGVPVGVVSDQGANRRRHADGPFAPWDPGTEAGARDESDAACPRPAPRTRRA